MASQITSLTIVYLMVYSGAYQRKHQSSASLVFVRGEFPAQRASNVENVSIWWRHHVPCGYTVVRQSIFSGSGSWSQVLMKQNKKNSITFSMLFLCPSWNFNLAIYCWEYISCEFRNRVKIFWSVPSTYNTTIPHLLLVPHIWVSELGQHWFR